MEKKIPARLDDGTTQPEGRVGRAWVVPEEEVVEEVRREFDLGIDQH